MINGVGKPIQEILSMVEPYSKNILRPKGSKPATPGRSLRAVPKRFPALVIDGSLKQPSGKPSNPVPQSSRRVLSFDYLRFQLDMPLLEDVSHE